MTYLVLLLLQLVFSPSPLPHQDCQRLCLGVCHWSWAKHRCMDTRCIFIGTWDPIPTNYVPPTESAFPVWKLPYPSGSGSAAYGTAPDPWGTYPLEQPRPEPPPEETEVQSPPEPPSEQGIWPPMKPPDYSHRDWSP